MMRHLILAVQFLTRLPTPQLADFTDNDLTLSARYFPLVGLLIGALLLLPFLLFAQQPWLAAMLALLLWVWVTGALHLDGLADITDAMGAAHSQPARFFDVLKDPHLGSFGAISLFMQLLVKLVLLHQLAGANWLALLLIPAWARFATLALSHYLPPLKQDGMGERFAWQLTPAPILIWALLLAVASLWLAPWLLLALLLVPLAAVYWQRRLGGISGDCLGASIEVIESLLLLTLVIAG